MFRVITRRAHYITKALMMITKLYTTNALLVITLNITPPRPS
jgi:hypothetical protein